MFSRRPPEPPLRLVPKALLAVRVWLIYARISRDVRRMQLPALVQRLGQPRRNARRRYAPVYLSHVVDRALRIGTYRPTCLVNSLVLFRLLREQGDEPELVVGLPEQALTQDAHAWVEIDGVDIGPAPGRSGHLAMARFA